MNFDKFYEKLEMSKYTRRNLIGIGRYVFDSEKDIIRGANNEIIAVSSSNKYPTLEQNTWFDNKINALRLLEEIKENILSDFKNTNVYEHIMYQSSTQDIGHLVYLIETFSKTFRIYQGFCLITSYAYVKKER